MKNLTISKEAEKHGKSEIISGTIAEINQWKKDFCVQGNNAKEIIEGLDKQCPGIKSRLFEEDGELKRFINIFVNDEDIRNQKGLDTKTKNGDEIIILAAASGG